MHSLFTKPAHSPAHAAVKNGNKIKPSEHSAAKANNPTAPDRRHGE
jgi:hypothetical protein